MRLIPVIDLLNNQAVHAVKGDRCNYKPVKSVLCETSDPLAVARAFRDQLGLKEIYIADLDAIQNPSRRIHRNLIENLACRENIDIILDAGISDHARISMWLNAGIHRIVVGSETLDTLDTAKEIPAVTDPSRVVFSLDCRNGKIISQCPVLRGLSPLKTLETLKSSGWREVILLDLARVGSGRGIHRPLAIEARANFPTLTLLVGGGITGPEEISALDTMGVDGILAATIFHLGIVGPDHLSGLQIQHGKHIPKARARRKDS
jgi:phosphoribosylformimino-5-aminoimidazole carboxamide ribotide isomerase